MCLFPVKASRQEFGKPALDPEGDLQLPCGKCFECKSKRSSEWALRARYEIADHDENSFITLTYNDENIPKTEKLFKRDFQLFIKKLRHQTDVRYMVSHEYGGKTGRPHHHAIIFGWNPPNQKYLQDAPSGERLFTSQDVEDLWKKGFHSIGEANEKTAYYIASYSLKSNSSTVLDEHTGELVQITDSFNCSRRPAIGKEYFLKNARSIVHNEKLLPRYFKKLLEDHNPDLFMLHEQLTNLDLTNKSTHERLAKYQITKQRLMEKDSSFRTAPENRKLYDSLTRYLKKEVSDYADFIKQRG